MNSAVFELNTSFGFFSIFFFLCKAYLFAKVKQLPFFVKNTKWAYDGGKGWHTYFKTLKSYDGTGNAITMRHGDMPFICPRFTLKEYMQCIREIFVLQDDLTAVVEAFVKDLGSYIAVYIRRGDKCAESPVVSEETIVSHMDLTLADTVFVQTDDYRVVERMRQLLEPMGKKVVSRIPTTKRGHYQNVDYVNNPNDTNPHKRNIVPFNNIVDKSIVYEDTAELLTSCLISCRGLACWVDYSSNVGRFMKLWSPETVRSYAGCPMNPDAFHDPYFPFYAK